MPRWPDSAPPDGVPQHIVPFYSERTLERVHVLVKNLHDDLAVYISKDRGFATIGTRGIRPLDGVIGLIVHLSVHLQDDGADETCRIVLDQPLHNLEYTSATPIILMGLLLETLKEAELLPLGFSKDDMRSRWF